MFAQTATDVPMPQAAPKQQPAPVIQGVRPDAPVLLPATKATNFHVGYTANVLVKSSQPAGVMFQRLLCGGLLQCFHHQHNHRLCQRTTRRTKTAQRTQDLQYQHHPQTIHRHFRLLRQDQVLRQDQLLQLITTSGARREESSEEDDQEEPETKK